MIRLDCHPPKVGLGVGKCGGPLGRYIRPSVRVFATAWVRFLTSSLRYTVLRWDLTVLSAIYSLRAMSRL
jgi:hypothetical protein